MPIAAAIIPAVIGAGATIYASSQANRAAKSAANAQTQAADQATALQREIWQQQRADNEPWRQAGVNALGRLNNLSTNPNAFTADPGYQWRAQQGIDQIDRSAASRGRLMSGGTLKALDRYNQGFASNEFQNVWNRQAGLAGVGQTANQGNASAGQNYANQAGQNFWQAGQARASGYMNQAAANNAMIGGLANIGTNLFGAWRGTGGGNSWNPTGPGYNYQGQY